MGLDQYLTTKKYYSNAEWHSQKNRKDFAQLKEISGISEYTDKDAPYINLEVNIGYWRKANAIHQWTVDNCQDGNDDCRTTHVSRDQLKTLKEICQAITDNPTTASELLPTSPGFFFGSTDYDEWYFRSLTDTIEIVNRCLSMPAGWDFYYSSSW